MVSKTWIIEYVNCKKEYKKYLSELELIKNKKSALEDSKDKILSNLVRFFFIAVVSTISLVLSITKSTDWVSLLVLSAYIGFILYVGVSGEASHLLGKILFQIKFKRIYNLHNEISKFEKSETQVKSVIDSLYKKLGVLETPLCENYEAELYEFYNDNLYRKHSGTVNFSEALEDFFNMLKEVSDVNSTLITKRVYLREYRDYISKRWGDHVYNESTVNNNRAPKRYFKNSPKSEDLIIPKVTSPEESYKVGRKVDNWDEICKKRQVTGRLGEDAVVVMQKEFLTSIGRQDLADKVQHSSATVGDGLGYDILSFFEDGREKYIEVKSTKVRLDYSFYISQNELDFLKEHSENYFLYRVLLNESDECLGLKVQSSKDVVDMNSITPNSYIVKPAEVE